MMKNADDNHFEQLKQWVSVAHHIPGRLRLKFKLSVISYLRDFNTDGIKSTLQSFPALKDYRLNIAAGSLVIEYDAQVIPFNLINQAFDQHPETSTAAITQLQQLAEQLLPELGELS